MRVLLTTDTVGGVWTFTRELTQQLLARGHQVRLMSFGKAPKLSQQSWARLTALEHGDSFRYFASDAPLEWMAENASAYTGALPELLHLVEDFGPEIIHSGQFCFGALPVDVPTVITAHSDVLSWAQACDPGTLAPSAWLTQYRCLVQRGLDRCAAVVAPTGWMLEALRQNFICQAPAHVISNGCDVAEYPPDPQSLQAVTAGRFWDKGKNLAMLVDLALPVIVAGELADSAGPALDLSENLRGVGSLCEEEMIALFRGSAVYVVPSLYEPFGLAPLEAARCGCAIVANDIPSLREVWGEGALYFRSSKELEKIVQHLQSHPATLQQARLRSQQKARHYSGAQMAEQYVRLYRDVLQSPLTPRRDLVYA